MANCELSCAEKNTISLEVGKLALKPESFVYSELAHDELFAAWSAEKSLRLKKAVEKIAAIDAATFWQRQSQDQVTLLLR